MTIKASDLVPIRDDLQVQVGKLTALITAESSSPVIPPPTNTTEIVPGGTPSSLTDSGSHIWTFGGPAPGQVGNKILRDNVQAWGNGVGVKLALKDGVIWALADGNAWYKDNGVNAWVRSQGGP